METFSCEEKQENDLGVGNGVTTLSEDVLTLPSRITQVTPWRMRSSKTSVAKESCWNMNHEA